VGGPPEVVRVVGARRALLPEEADLAVALLEAPVGAHGRLGGDVAVRHGEAVVAVEAHRAGPADAGDAGLVDGVAQVHRVVRDHRAEDDDAALVDQLLVALADLEVVLPRQAAGIHRDDLDGTVVDAFVHGVLDGEDRGVDPVGEQLADVHVDEDPDLHRLERVALRLDAAGRRIDRDALDGLLPDPATALVPTLVLPGAELGGVDARVDRRHGPVVLGDAVVDRCREQPLGVDRRLGLLVGHR
jgi:hypothetical protein